MTTTRHIHDLRWVMNELGFLGFPEGHRDEIARKMEADSDKFMIPGRIILAGMKGQEDIDYTLYFKKYDRINAYHPYMYQAELPHMGRSQNFRIVQDASFSLKDAFNMLHGRAIHKLVIDHNERRLKPYWFQLDLASKDGHGNHPIIKYPGNDHQFSIGRELEARGVREMAIPAARVNLILSLYHGNAEPVTIRNGVSDQLVFAVASPKERSVKLYLPDATEIKTSASKDKTRSQLLIDDSPSSNRRKGRGL